MNRKGFRRKLSSPKQGTFAWKKYLTSPSVSWPRCEVSTYQIQDYGVTSTDQLAQCNHEVYVPQQDLESI
jgi:hypothetical protein